MHGVVHGAIWVGENPGAPACCRPQGPYDTTQGLGTSLGPNGVGKGSLVSALNQLILTVAAVPGLSAHAGAFGEENWSVAGGSAT